MRLNGSPWMRRGSWLKIESENERKKKEFSYNHRRFRCSTKAWKKMRNERKINGWKWFLWFYDDTSINYCFSNCEIPVYILGLPTVQCCIVHIIIIIIQTYYEEKTGRDKACQSHLSIEEHPHSSFCTLTRLSLSPTDCDQRQGRATLQPHHSLSQNISNCCSSRTKRNHIMPFQHFNTTFTFILVVISYASIKLGPGKRILHF